MTERSKHEFGQFTRSHTGRPTEYRLDAKVVMSPWIREPILGGTLHIANKFSNDEAKGIAERLSAGGKLEVEAVRQ